MDERESGRTRARSDSQTPQSPGGRNRTASDADYISPTRNAFGADDGQEGSNTRRHSSMASRRSGASGDSSLGPRTTLAQRTQGKFTLAGPDETPSCAWLKSHSPVWSLAKPLPRVVRTGMVPTKEELLQNLANAQRPTENSQRYGLDVNPNDIEQGRIDKTNDPRKMAAQVEDARLQRENNFMNKILNGDGTSMRQTSRMSRTSSKRGSIGGRRSAGWDHPVDNLSTVEEADSQHNYEPGEHYPEDLHPLVQDLVEDEVHNNHTTWSVIRTHHREALAEALAVFVQLTTGFCVDLSVTCANQGNPNTTAWGWGLATMMGIYISGGVSGAHMNPIVTIVLWFYRGFPKRLIPEYFAAQFLAALCAGLCAYGIYYQSITNYLILNADSSIINSFVTNQREAWIGPATAFFNEFIGTTVLLVTVLALGDDQNAPPGAGMNSLVVGLVISCLSMTFGYQTGAAFNPARDFGPRLALLAVGFPSTMFTNPYWFYGPWAGALSGGFFGAFLYDFFIFTGGESPVNYPWERTERAMTKSAMKWKHRLHLD
ncbi:hypothetical protein N7499_013242 [Penicillium canescens]|nr:hypothetical protein N7499_013242 [Penicillium canescens]